MAQSQTLEEGADSRFEGGNAQHVQSGEAEFLDEQDTQEDILEEIDQEVLVQIAHLN